MQQDVFDVIYAGDFRRCESGCSAVCNEIDAHSKLGYRTGLLFAFDSTSEPLRPIDPRLRHQIDSNLAELVHPARPLATKLLCIHNPTSLPISLFECTRINADLTLLVFSRFPKRMRNALGALAADIRGLTAGDVLFAPAAPNIRKELQTHPCALPLLAHDWSYVLDCLQWPRVASREDGDVPVVGRYGKPDASKWPSRSARILAAYPPSHRIIARFLIEEEFLKKSIEQIPFNWQILNDISPKAFLRLIHFFIYQPSPEYNSEILDYPSLESMASGIVTLLPSNYRDLFEEGAIYYNDPSDIVDIVELIHSSSDLRFTYGNRGVQIARDKFDISIHQRRLRDVIGRPMHKLITSQQARRTNRVIFLSSNGIGIGHLTRTLSIARRLPEHIEPIIVTMCQAIEAAQTFGWISEYIPSHSYLGSDTKWWNIFLAKELMEKISFYDAHVVLFDGNVPYSGLLAALKANPDCWSIWTRRPMWRPGTNPKFIEREMRFDCVLEPTEVAAKLDVGATTLHTRRTWRVSPMLLIDDSDLLSREEARNALHLAHDKTAALIRLGSGNNFKTDFLRDLVIARLQDADANIEILELEWPIANEPSSASAGALPLEAYPVHRYIRAFDFAISAAGYNSYHELLLAGIPTVFVPNEGPMIDNQLARSIYADAHGLGLCLRAHEVYRVVSVLEKIMDRGWREQVTTRCAQLSRKNGAHQAAKLIEDLVHVRKYVCGRE